MLALTAVCWLVTRRLALHPNRRQIVLELLVTGISQQIEDVIRKDAQPYLPLLGTLFIFLVTANLSGVLPGIEAPTSKLETPAALALIVLPHTTWEGPSRPAVSCRPQTTASCDRQSGEASESEPLMTCRNARG